MRDRRVEVQCDCGQRTVVRPGCLTGGKTRSCGCLRRENTRARKTKHGYFGTRLYGIWAGMLDRCGRANRLDYGNYGGRGIKVCKAWHRFEPFRDWAIEHGYDDELTLDRKDTDGNYCPSNCRWATRQQQAQSQRRRQDNQTGFIGVSLYLRHRYVARASRAGHIRHLGYFDDPFSAAWVRDAYVQRHYDRHARLNNLRDRRERVRWVRVERRGTFEWGVVLSK